MFGDTHGRPEWDTDRLLHDMAAEGINQAELARRTATRTLEGLSPTTIWRFLNGEAQSNKVGARITRAMGKPKGHYLRSAGDQSPAAAVDQAEARA